MGNNRAGAFKARGRNGGSGFLDGGLIEHKRLRQGGLKRAVAYWARVLNTVYMYNEREMNYL